MTTDKPIDYDNIYLQGRQYKSGGKIKLVPGGIGWKEAATATVTTLRGDEFKKISWLRASRDYQLRIQMKDGSIYKFDGFPREAYETLKEFSKNNYRLNIEPKELCLKGWNWGKAQVQNHQLEFTIQGKTAFELPLAELSSAVVSGKNEVSVEMNQAEPTTSNKRLDSLVDIRFYIPPSNEIVEEEPDTIDAATAFCTILKSSTDIGAAGAGVESLVNFSELPFLVPRGRYEADLYISLMRLRGKSYDYKIAYSSILKIFLLPKPDDLHVLMIMMLDPPLRQGQTRYPFLIIQFARDAEIQTSILLTDEAKTKFGGKLENEYEGPQYEVFSNILKIAAEKKIIVPGTFKSFHGTSCIKCSLKANEGHLYFLEKSIIFVPKPTILILHENIVNFTFSRVDGSTNSRTFDVKVSLHEGTDHQFSNINKEELNIIENYLRDKKIKFQNELPEKKKPKYKDADESSEDEIIPINSEEEEESTDEDYNEGDHISGAESESGDETESEEGDNDGDDE